MSRVALIVGASGQTGSLLAHSLLSRGDRVIGSSRSVESTDWWRHQQLGITADVERVSMVPEDFDDVLTCLTRYQPNDVFYLAGQSSVSLSFEKPFEAVTSNATTVVNVLEAIRKSGMPTRFFNAASTDCFGNQPGVALNENSPMRPVSPYAASKVASYWATVTYRENFGLHASNGILTNNESHLRGEGFVTNKIVTTLKRKRKYPSVPLELGNTSISRDWLWAGDAVEAIIRIVRADFPGDYIVASGQSRTLHELVVEVCRVLDMDPDGVYSTAERFFRATEIHSIELDPTLLRRTLGWRHTLEFDQLAQELVDVNSVAGVSRVFGC